MRSIIEFALFAWVAISVIAVLVQLVRIARYKRSNAGTSKASKQDAKPEAATIDLAERLNTADATKTTDAEPAPSQVLAGSQTAPASTPKITLNTPPAASAAAAPPMTPPVAAPTPATPAPVTPTADPAPVDSAPATPPIVDSPSVATPSAKPEHAPAAPAEPAAAATPTLADLLAGVRLPWNLLPAVDQSREPSNDRVALITSEGEPSAIGVDVADELERLGFTISPLGDDTALATRDGHSLGLQIIEAPMTAEVDGIRRFPTATESSVALDIWVQ